MKTFSLSQKTSGTFCVEFYVDHAIVRTTGSWNSELVEMLAKEAVEELQSIPRHRFAVLTDHQCFEAPTPEAMKATNELNKVVGKYFPDVTYAMVCNPGMQKIFRELAVIQNKDTGIKLAFFDTVEESIDWLNANGFDMKSKVLQRIEGSHFTRLGD